LSTRPNTDHYNTGTPMARWLPTDNHDNDYETGRATDQGRQED